LSILFENIHVSSEFGDYYLPETTWHPALTFLLLITGFLQNLDAYYPSSQNISGIHLFTQEIQIPHKNWFRKLHENFYFSWWQNPSKLLIDFPRHLALQGITEFLNH